MIVLGLQEWIMIMKHLKMHKTKIMKIKMLVTTKAMMKFSEKKTMMK